ncbi:MAG: hypothetical protein IVW55_04755 [Chloroflexi bacterium]|nr:hypothetical protein [Chloroflexota bacterium]
MRQHRSLNGLWQFQIDPEGSLSVASLFPEVEIPVPMPWQAALPDMRAYSGYAWYRRYVDLEDEWLSGELILSFGAVDYWCQVFVNGRLAGEHEGGYTAFSMPIRSYVQPGRNEIAVRVYDSAQASIIIPRWPSYPPSTNSDEPPFDANNIPHGKQEWYVNVGGIWQGVSLTAVPLAYIEHLKVTPDIHNGIAHIVLHLAESRQLSTPNGTIRATVASPDGTEWGGAFPVVPEQNLYEMDIEVGEARLWALDDPYLYTATALLETPQGKDELSARFGFREISTSEGRILLNGEPIYLLSALDQDLYPDTIYTVPSETYLREEFRKAKELGFNNLRCHIKPPDPLYLELADEMGLLVWAEIPSWRTFYPKGTLHAEQLELTDGIKARVEQTLREMIYRDYNHPSLIIWTIVNEDWGPALALQASDRAWLVGMYELCKELDPTRLVVDNSACPQPWGPNVHVKSDLDDFHIYANIPDGARSFTQTIEQFDLRPLWTYSSHGDSQRTGREPLVLSEFGNWGLPSLRALGKEREGEPHWFNVGPWWSPWEGEAGWPSGVEERFHKLGLDKIWGSYEQFATATQWHQFAALKFEIEALRRQPAIMGYVITELADAYWESNGLLDFERNPKAYFDIFSSINAPDMICSQSERYSYWDDQRLHVRPHLAHFSRAEWRGAQLAWSIEGTELGGHCAVPPLQRAEVEALELQAWPLPKVEGPQMVQVKLALDNKGKRLARNTLDVLVMPASARQHSYKGEVAVITRHNRVRATPTGGPNPTVDLEAAPQSDAPVIEEAAPRGSAAEGRVGLDLVSTISMLGYQAARHITPQTGLAVTNYPNADLLQWVRGGGDLLFLSQGTSPFFWVQGRGAAYGGNWITSFSWLRPQLHRRLKAPNPLSMPFIHVMPQRTILGLPVEDRAVQEDFLSGMVSGWVRHPAVHTVQFRYGKGRVIMTTFALEENLHQDPVATALFHDLVDHLTSDACQPTLTANLS